MLSLTKPSPDAIRRFIDGQRGLGLSYASVGATAGSPPPEFKLDHTRVQLGTGEKAFRAARRALQRWQQFHLGWLEVYPRDAALQTGEVVAVLAHAAGLWWLNACRVVYTLDEVEPIGRFGFAYGTLPQHAGTGEERFQIEWDPASDSVWYDVLAFSRPQHFLAKLGYPLVRQKQRRFGRESAAAMQRAVAATTAAADVA